VQIPKSTAAETSCSSCRITRYSVSARGPSTCTGLPTRSCREGNFSELNVAIWIQWGAWQNGFLRSPPCRFPGNIIPINRQSPQTKALYEFAPLPNSTSEGAPGTIPQRNYRQASAHHERQGPVPRSYGLDREHEVELYGRFSWSDEAEINGGLKLNGGKILTTAKQY
jgi:hypothetical protein